MSEELIHNRGGVMKIAFLGTGIMGAGMAHNLLKAGYNVTVWNRTVEKAEPLVQGNSAGSWASV